MTLNPNATIGERIRALRLNDGYSQGQLARALYVTQPTLSYWESGRYQTPVPMLVVIADMFGVTLDWLIAGREVHDRRVLIGGRS